MSTDPSLRLLQFADGLFPAGAYAHSFGLESYVEDGRVRNRATLEDFLRGHLEGAAGPCDAVIVAEAIRRGAARDEDGALCLDADIDALRSAAELREASRQMGRQTLRIASELTGDAFVGRFAEHAAAGRTPAHHPLVFGLIGGVLSWDPRQAALAYLQAGATAIVSAALRLMPMGQLDGQRALWAMGSHVSRLAAEAAAADIADLSSFTPGLEIASMQHSRLEARLFRS
jgi:urease accessory protein